MTQKCNIIIIHDTFLNEYHEYAIEKNTPSEIVLTHYVRVLDFFQIVCQTTQPLVQAGKGSGKDEKHNTKTLKTFAVPYLYSHTLSNPPS